MHFESNKYRVYYRLIPDENFFSVDSKRYLYDKTHIINKSDNLIVNEKLIIDNIQYKFDKLTGINRIRSKIMEIHYFYNNPIPINYNNEKGIASENLSATEFAKLYENDLFIKLLTIDDEKKLLTMVMMLVIGNIVVTTIVILKLFHFI